MTIRQIGGVFGRNPKFNDVEAETLEVSGSITSGGDPTFEGASGRSLTLKNTSTAATAGDLIGEVLFFGSDASAPGAGIKSKIKVIADGGSGDGSRLFISTSDGVTNDIDRMEFNKDGDVKVLTGNLVMATSGAGIDFSATSGTGTSELFDDYEEGTFEPALKNATTTVYATQLGRYTKVGNMVYCHVRLQITTLGDGDPNEIVGFPFTADTTGGNGHHASFGYYSSAVNVIALYSNLAGTTMEVMASAAAGATPSNPANVFGDGRRLDFSIAYRAS